MYVKREHTIADMSVHMCLCLYVCVCLCVRMCVCVCVGVFVCPVNSSGAIHILIYYILLDVIP